MIGASATQERIEALWRRGKVLYQISSALAAFVLMTLPIAVNSVQRPIMQAESNARESGQLPLMIDGVESTGDSDPTLANARTLALSGKDSAEPLADQRLRTLNRACILIGFGTTGALVMLVAGWRRRRTAKAFFRKLEASRPAVAAAGDMPVSATPVPSVAPIFGRRRSSGPYST